MQHISVLSLVNSLLIILGLVLMSLAISKGIRLLPELKIPVVRRGWSHLLYLMRFFLLGYGVSLIFVLTGNLAHLSQVTSIIFAVGALFVLLSVKGTLVISRALLHELNEHESNAFEAKKIASMFRAVIESTTDGVLVVDRSGQIIHYNQNFLKMWRVPESLLALKDGRKVFAYVQDELQNPDWLQKRTVQIYSQSNAISSDVVEFKDGRVFERFSQPQNLGEKYFGRVWSFRDITDLKKIQSDLEKRVEKRTDELSQVNIFLDSLIENIPDMIFVKEAKDLKFVRFNRAGEELLGYDRSILIGKNDYDFFPKAEADFFITNDRAVLSSRKLLDIPEEPIHTLNKGIRILHTKKLPILGYQGQPEYLLGISEDITEKKHAEKVRFQLIQEQSVRAEAERGIHLREDFISIASHELKTPLTALQLQLQLIPKLLQKTQFSEKEHVIKLFQTSLKQLGLFSRLVDQLLDVSRIRAGSLVLEPQPVKLSDLIFRVLEQYDSDLKSAGSTVRVQLDKTVEGIWDLTRMEQVVVNLLSNAMKYGAGKPIEVTTSQSEGWVKLVVKDQGIGMTKEDQRKIFERFGRAVPLSKFRGLGLGLYITRQIVQAHGGSIQVFSKIGEGSTFVVDIPLQVRAKIKESDQKE